MIYRSIIRVITSIISIDILWVIIKPVSIAFSLLLSKRTQIEGHRIIRKSPISDEIKKLTVLNGPFKGMKYPTLSSIGSSVYPKIIGSYEYELDNVLKEILANNYSDIVDIGCAEGYYAVGLGRNFPNARIICYDIDPEAIRLCKKMALLNSVKNIEWNKKCTSEELSSMQFREKGLVISDCEGFEKYLFDSKSVKNLYNCDVLIESHDFIDINISDDLERLFSATHDVQKIKSKDDLDKANTYIFPESQELDLTTKGVLFAEGRPQLMIWLYCKPKNS